MKKNWLRMTFFAMALVALAPVAGMAQEDQKEKDKVKEEKKKDFQQVIITRTNNDEKVVVEINGDKVTVNGKPIEELKKDGSDINVRVNKVKDIAFFNGMNGFTASDWKWNGGDNFKVFTEDANRAMLGVTTEKTEQGASILSIAKESAAEKLGLKSGDVITKVDDKKIESPDDLTAAIKAHKPGDKVTVTYLRDKKEQKGSADLTAWKSHTLKSMDVADLKLNFDNVFPRTPSQPRVYTVPGQAFSRTGAPKLGLSVQDTDDGKGVKVIEVDEESNAAKAGLKKDDLITEVDGKVMNSTDEMVKMIRESKDKTSIMVKLQRAGKTQNIEVKIPRKIKTVDM